MKASNTMRPGDNHTGIALHPEMTKEMLEGTAEFGPTSRGGPDLIAANRVRVAKESHPAATMPPVEAPAEDLALLDKLGARLAFERMGVRLYDALISKYDAYGTYTGGPSRDDLAHIRDEEHRHMQLVEQMILAMGGDPTTITPCANLQATASRGIGDVLVDPRTNLVECLDAMMVAELADHESWEMLASVAQLAKRADFEPKIREAEQTEAEHMVKVRGWLAAATKP
jgi:hypothetical protein